MTDFQKYDPNTHKIVKLIEDWNNLLKHGLVGGVSFIIRYDESEGEFQALDGTTKNVTFHNTDASIVIQSAISMVDSSGGKIVFTEEVFHLNSELLIEMAGWWNHPLVFEGEGDGTVLEADSAINIFHLTQVDATRSNLIIKNMRIIGGDLATAINLTGCSLGVGDQHFEDLFITHCAVGVKGAFCDTALVNVNFDNCGLGAEINQSMMQFFRCMFRMCETAVKFNSTTAGHTGFYGTVFSGCNYVFHFVQDGHSMACYDCWFENLGEKAGHIGDPLFSNMFKTDLLGTSNAERPWLFSQCYFSGSENWDVGWLSPEYWRQNVRFDGCTFMFYDDYEKFNSSGGFYPRFIHCFGYTSAPSEYWIMSSEQSGTVVIGDGGTITHILGMEPQKVLVSGRKAGEMVTVTSTNPTTMTVAIKMPDGSPGQTQAVTWWVGF